jgi:hypothetical protein
MARITDIDFTKSPKSLFTIGSKEVSYADYYKSAYKITIKNLNQPLLVYEQKTRSPTSANSFTIKKIYLIPELCKFVGLLEEQKADFNFK